MPILLHRFSLINVNSISMHTHSILIDTLLTFTSVCKVIVSLDSSDIMGCYTRVNMHIQHSSL